jgi:hypothetical protein
MQYQAGAKRPNYILPKGEYPAQIVEADVKTSKAGNPMLVLELEVYDGERKKYVKDYIVSGGEYAQDWKIGHLVKACGLSDDGNVDPANLIQRNVRVKIKVKPARGDYQEDNAVEDYIVQDVTAVAVEPTRTAPASTVSTADEPPF